MTDWKRIRTIDDLPPLDEDGECESVLVTTLDGAGNLWVSLSHIHTCISTWAGFPAGTVVWEFECAIHRWDDGCVIAWQPRPEPYQGD